MTHRARLVDLDGTLADSRHRDQYAPHLCADDIPVEWLMSKVRQHEADGETIMIVTNRDSARIGPTLDWLRKHDVPFAAIYTRQTGDTRKGSEVKRDAVRHIRDLGYTIVGAYEDNPWIVAMYGEEGVPVRAVALPEVFTRCSGYPA